MKVRRKARAVLLDGDHLVFLRRGWPGGSSYCTTVGGSVEPDDPDTGDFTPVRVPMSASALDALNLQHPN
ncbi:hypothetical protein [Streptomyces sp. NBC_01465]|uniref:hypothetical protein n=1 Tax=Streptomyces sp. NBC_01465 TaxID=2903878 RepID=UPI003FCC43EE